MLDVLTTVYLPQRAFLLWFCFLSLQSRSLGRRLGGLKAPYLGQISVPLVAALILSYLPGELWGGGPHPGRKVVRVGFLEEACPRPAPLEL